MDEGEYEITTTIDDATGEIVAQMEYEDVTYEARGPTVQIACFYLGCGVFADRPDAFVDADRPVGDA
jgi:hypothetical protein